MKGNRNRVIVVLSVLMTVSASVGFYEFGLGNWLNKGCQNGFSGGSNSTLIKAITFVSFDQIKLV